MTSTCYIHIGTHKTGTTSIQKILSLVPSTYSEIYLPKSGFYGGGHHNLAWQLNGDPRFDEQHGTWEKLTQELDHLKPKTAVISSEDFEYLYAKPNALLYIKDSLGSICYTPKIIIYLRSRPDYILSLYNELLKHGLILSLHDFIRDIISQGNFKYNQLWNFSLEYASLINSFERVFLKDNLIIRNYHSTTNPGILIEDFFKIICPQAPEDVIPNYAPIQLNSSLTSQELIEEDYLQAITSTFARDDLLLAEKYHFTLQ